MNSLDRFNATIQREKTDHPASWLSWPTPAELPILCAYYGVKNLHELQIACGTDVYAVDVPYQSPEASYIFAAFNWYEKGSNVDPQHRTLTADGCFRYAESTEEIRAFDWPDPALYIDREECRRRVNMAPKNTAVLGQCWSAHFQDACASFGMETALCNFYENPELYKAVDDKLINFYLRANEIFYEATRDRLNAVIIGNDFGSQLGLMISEPMIREFVIPGAKKLVEQAHSYGLKVLYHSCGAVSDSFPALIEIGVDALHPIQPNASGMDPERLKELFADRVSFCGGVDDQDLLVNGSQDDVRRKVMELRDIFPTGLIISPSQGVIMEDVPPQNIHAMLEAARAKN